MQLCGSLSILWNCLSLGLECKLTFSSPVATGEFSKFAGILSAARKVMLKILQGRLQQYVNHELPDVQAGFTKGRGTRDQIANILWIMEKARETSISALLTMPKSLTVWITINCGKF